MQRSQFKGSPLNNLREKFKSLLLTVLQGTGTWVRRKDACAICFFPLVRKLIDTARWPSSLGMLIGPRPHHESTPVSAGGRGPAHSFVNTSTFALKEGNFSPSAVSSGRFAGSKSQSVGRLAPVGNALRSVRRFSFPMSSTIIENITQIPLSLRACSW